MHARFPKRFQSTRAHAGARRYRCCGDSIVAILPALVSIHAPPRGRDSRRPDVQFESAQGCRSFNPRAPRGATSFFAGDRILTHVGRVARCFNPRAPRGARHVLRGFDQQLQALRLHLCRSFKSHARPRGARRCAPQHSVSVQGWLMNVSIHAPHAGRVTLDAMANSGRSPLTLYVSFHAPHGGRDAPTN